MPSGRGWTAYSDVDPPLGPVAEQPANWDCSSGVVMTRISRMPAIISVVSG